MFVFLVVTAVFEPLSNNRLQENDTLMICVTLENVTSIEQVLTMRVTINASK